MLCECTPLHGKDSLLLSSRVWPGLVTPRRLYSEKKEGGRKVGERGRRENRGERENGEGREREGRGQQKRGGMERKVEEAKQ